jgi:hypothetical protein
MDYKILIKKPFPYFIRGCIYLWLSFFVLCCKNDKDPQGALEKYIQQRFANKQDKAQYLDFLTGESLEFMTQISEKNWEELKKSSHYELLKFHVESKRCQDDKSCTLTYTLSYKVPSLDREKKFAVVDVKKIATMKDVGKESSQWKVQRISTIKTFIDNSSYPLEML